MRSELWSTLTKFQGREERVGGQQVKPGGMRQGRMERRSAGEKFTKEEEPQGDPKTGTVLHQPQSQWNKTKQVIRGTWPCHTLERV